MKSTKPPKRHRLPPEARREQLLDAAKVSILRDGLQQFSLRKLAVEASVSEPLLFHYFGSRTDLLRQLLERDYKQFTETLNSALDGAESLQEILYIYVCSNYDQLPEESLVDILLTDPELASAIEEQRTLNIKTREKLLVDRISGELGITRKMASMLALMGSAASIAAAKYAHRSGIGREQAVASATQFIAAGFESQRNEES